MTPSENCYSLIRHFEGCRLKAYKCPAGIWTIGYGNTQYEDGRMVKAGDMITQSRAATLLQLIVAKFAISTDMMVKQEIRQHEFDALVSFCYNVGVGNLEKSTLLRKVNRRSPSEEVRAEFMKWNKARGQELAGLTRRRASEAYLFINGKNNF